MHKILLLGLMASFSISAATHAGGRMAKRNSSEGQSKTSTQRQIRILYPGTMVANHETRVIDGKFPSAMSFAKQLRKEGKGAMGFDYQKKTTLTTESGEVLKGKTKNLRRTVLGKILELKDIPKTKKNEILRSNMKVNGIKRVVRSDAGWINKLDKGVNVQ